MKKKLRSFYCDDETWFALVEHVDAHSVELDTYIEATLKGAIERGDVPKKSPGLAKRRERATRRFAAGTQGDESEVRVGRREEFPSVEDGLSAPGVTEQMKRDKVSADSTNVETSVRQQLKERLDEHRPQLRMTISDRTVIIEKDRFVLGRSSRGTDFVVRDENVSRKHCAVLYHAGEYYMQDLNSTNGTEFDSKKVELRRIESGDIFTICDHKLHFEIRD